MSTFEFAFSLFGLLLGLSVAEVMAGFARVLKARRNIRLGWLTPLLGMVLVVDLVTFWENSWSLRNGIEPNLLPLLFGTLVTAIYYLSASLVFPDSPSEWPDLDAWFMAHKGHVMSGVLAANLLVTAAMLKAAGMPPWHFLLIPLAYTLLVSALALTSSKVLSGGVLVVFLSLPVLFRLI